MNPERHTSTIERTTGRCWLLAQSSLAALCLAFAAATSLPACSRTAPTSAAPSQAAVAQQVIIDRAADALDRVRDNPRFAGAETYFLRARGVMIFPRVVKASFLLGGEGGNGVLVRRQAGGSWSNPAFYSIGGPSVGLQVGYQEATVVLFIMDDLTLERVTDSTLELGATSGATLGTVGERGETRGQVLSHNIYTVVDAGGVFAGVSLEGCVIAARQKHNTAYYGSGATPQAILEQGSEYRSQSDLLKQALAPRPQEVRVAKQEIAASTGAPRL